ncbi:MAG: ABC transporter ATP-binding protein [Synergistaceae bacterium]|nr:ABC transporter ATP-binding protein [Synergistaceae bacterium]
MSRILDIKNLTYKYGEISAVQGISLHVDDGEIVTLIGGNGAGKTTTLRAVSGLNRDVQKGTIFFRGDDISGISASSAAKLGIAHCLEGRHIFPQLTVQENLDMGYYLHSDSQAKKALAGYVYELFPILKDRRTQTGGSLSGGEQQMLALGRALMQKPKLLLLDEPSLGLAPKMIDVIFDAVVRINLDEGLSILLVEQNCNIALSVANRGYVMETGSIILDDSAGKLLDNPIVRNSYLGIE